MPSNQDRLNLEVKYAVSFLASASVAASFYPGWHLWGLDTPGAFPSWLRIAFLVPLLILAVPQLDSKIGRPVARLLDSLTGRKLAVIYILLAVVFFVSFMVLSSRNYFLGDAYNIQGNIRAGRFFSPTEPLGYLVHQLIFRMLGEDSLAAVTQAYAITSYLSGAIFLYLLYSFIKDKVYLILSLGIVVCFVTIQFFFGYVENYTISFTLAFFYSLSAMRDFSSDRLSLITIVLPLMACAFQVSMAILIPSLVFLAALRYFPEKKYLILFSTVIIIVLAGAIYLNLSESAPLSGALVPLTGSSGNPYTMFSGWHLRDLLNLTLLIYPLIMVIIFAGNLRRKFFTPFNLVLIGPGLLFVLLIDPKLGAYRDWDLMTIASAPIIAFLVNSLVLENAESGHRNYAMFIVLGLFGVLHSGGWILRNASSEKSYAAVKAAVRNDLHYSKDYMSGFRNKSWAKLSYDLAGDLREATRAEYERYLGDPADAINTSQLADELLMVGDTSRAIEIVSDNWTRFMSEPRAIVIMGRVMIGAGLFKQTDMMYHQCLSKVGEMPLIYYALGEMKQLQGQEDSAYFYFDKAYNKASDAPVGKQYQFYINCFAFGYDNLAQKGLIRIAPGLPFSDKKYADYIIAVLNEGDTAKIDSLRASLHKMIIMAPSQ
jgi:hypothetical protein